MGFMIVLETRIIKVPRERDIRIPIQNGGQMLLVVDVCSSDLCQRET